MRTVLACMSMVLLLASCAVDSTQTRIARNGGKYSMLSPKHRELVAAGRITQGMSKDAVYLAWGSPSKVFQIEENGIAKQRWVYTRSEPAYTTSVGVGYGGYPRYGRWGYGGGMDYGGPQTVYVSEEFATVVFAHDKVETWERKQSTP